MQEQRAYPLEWPEGWERTPNGRRRHSNFRVPLSRSLDDLIRELNAWRVDDRALVISSNLRPRLDGRPYANQPKTGFDPGVAVYFTLRKRPLVMACDRFVDVDGNVRAIGLSIKALRSLDRYGASQLLERAFRGFDALPSPDDPWDVLGLERGADAAAITQRFRALARAGHPDSQGDGLVDMDKLKRARDAALREA